MLSSARGYSRQSIDLTAVVILYLGLIRNTLVEKIIILRELNESVRL